MAYPDPNRKEPYTIDWKVIESAPFNILLHAAAYYTPGFLFHCADEPEADEPIIVDKAQ